MIETSTNASRRAVSIAVLALAAFGCTAPAGAGGEATPAEAGAETTSPVVGVEASVLPALSVDQAIAIARKNLPPEEGKEVWATMAGNLGSVYGALAHQDSPAEQPPVEGADRPVWGVQFKVAIEICGPQSKDANCEIRDALRTVYVDQMSGEWIRTSTYAAAPGDPLPLPDK